MGDGVTNAGNIKTLSATYRSRGINSALSLVTAFWFHFMSNIFSLCYRCRLRHAIAKPWLLFSRCKTDIIRRPVARDAIRVSSSALEGVLPFADAAGSFDKVRAWPGMDAALRGGTRPFAAQRPLLTNTQRGSYISPHYCLHLPSHLRTTNTTISIAYHIPLLVQYARVDSSICSPFWLLHLSFRERYSSRA